MNLAGVPAGSNAPLAQLITDLSMTPEAPIWGLHPTFWRREAASRLLFSGAGLVFIAFSYVVGGAIFMAREAVKDIDEISEKLIADGRLKFRLRGAFVPVTGGVNHKQRREFGLDW